MGLKDFPRDGSVEHDEQEKHNPEDAHKDVVGRFVPLASQFIFEVHTLDARDLPGALVGQDDVGNGEQQQQQPHHHRQDFAGIHRLDEGGRKRLHDFVIPVEADEPEEDNADVHADVEEHGGAPAHEDAQLPGPQARVAENLEGKSQAHEEVGDDNVLEIDDETLGTGHVEEDPSRHAVEHDPCDEDQKVQRGDDLLGYEAVPGAGHCRRHCGGGIHPAVTSEGVA